MPLINFLLWLLIAHNTIFCSFAFRLLCGWCPLKSHPATFCCRETIDRSNFEWIQSKQLIFDGILYQSYYIRKKWHNSIWSSASIRRPRACMCEHTRTQKQHRHFLYVIEKHLKHAKTQTKSTGREQKNKKKKTWNNIYGMRKSIFTIQSAEYLSVEKNTCFLLILFAHGVHLVIYYIHNGVAKWFVQGQKFFEFVIKKKQKNKRLHLRLSI